MVRVSYSQAVPDSLILKLNNAASDSERVRTLLDIGENIEATSLRESMNYYHQALASAQKIHNNHLILSAYNDIGVAYIESNQFDSAITTFQKAIGVAYTLKDTLRVARITANIGNVHLHLRDQVKAIEYYLQAVALWEKCRDQMGLPGLYSNIGMLFSDQKEYGKAVEYGNKAFALAEQIGDHYSAVNALLNLSGTYSDLHESQKQFSLLNQALPLAKKDADIEQIATVYHNLGDYYFARKEFRPSLDNYLKSYAYVQKMDNQYHLCTSYTVLAIVYMNLGQLQEAKKNILLAEDLAAKVGARVNLKDIYHARAEIEQKLNNYKASSEYFRKEIKLSDSLFKAATSEKVAEVEGRYQNEKKQKEIIRLQNEQAIQALSLKQKSLYNKFLVALLAALILISVVGFRNLRHRQQLSKQQDELQKTRISELEKDKRLVAVDSMMKGEENERSRLAKDLHDGLGGLLSGVKFTLSNMKDNLIVTPDNQAVFERSLDMLDTSIRELRRVAHNMMPEMLVKYGLDETVKDYCNSINATQLLVVKYQSVGMNMRLDSSMEIIIYRIVQELLNNVLKHASASEVLVQLINEKNRLSIIVEDNGKGFDTAILDTSQAAGFASIRSRVDYLKGQLEINSEAGKGTLVNIEFKT